MRKLLSLIIAILMSASASAQTAMRMAHAPQHKAVASGNPVIFDRPEGELKTYLRSGQCFYRPTDYQLLDGEQSGTIRIVYGDDGKHVWMEGPVTYLDNKAWVEGTISGNTITLPLRENVAYYPEYDAYTQLVFLNTHNDEEEGILYFPTDEETTVATFTIDADGTVRLEDSHEEHVLALVWSDTGDWTGFADYNSVYTLRTPPTAAIPFFESLMTQESFDRFTVDDVNNDGKTWQWEPTYHCAYYAYSQTMQGDDWLFTPGLPMEAGRNYVFSMDATTYSDWCPEVLEICVGRQPLGSEATQVVMPEFEMLAVGEYIVYDHYESRPFSVDEDGTYYVGIHAKSQPYMWYPLVRNVGVNFALDGAAPQTIETVHAEAPADGSLTATLIFDVPTESIDGVSIAGKQVDVAINRDGQLLTTVSYAAGTKQAQYVDASLARAGKYIYELTPSCDGHVGKSTEAEVYVGYDVPSPVEVFTVKDTDRSLLFEWQHVTKGQNGGHVNTEALSYDLYKMGYDDNTGEYYLRDLLNDTPVRGTSFSLADYNTDSGAQGFDVFGIVPHCDGFESDLYSFSTAYLLVGTPDTLPYHESVTDHHLSSFWTWEGSEQQVYLYYATDSSDGDGEAMNLQADNLGAVGTLESGKIALRGETNATLWFNVRSDVAGNIVRVKAIKPDLTEDVLQEFTTTKDFSLVKVPLGQYAGQHWIRLYFETTFAQGTRTIFDDFNIKALHAHDLAVTLSAPTSIHVGEQTHVDITVQNLGEQAVSNYEVRLLSGTEVLSSRTILETLDFYAKRTISLPYAPSIFTPESDVQLTAQVISEGDEQSDNDASAVMMTLKAPVVTAPEKLVIVDDVNGRVTLSWDAPAYSAAAVTEDFEDFQPWSTDNFGEWTAYNADDCYAASLFSDVKYPCQGKQFAYTVYNYDGSNVQEAHSGSRFLSAFYGSNEAGTKYAAVDDWLISPELPGIAQTISFYAWGRVGYEEVFDVLYSTTDARPESFRSVWMKSMMVADSRWERIEADLPQATRYFAIRRHNTSGGQVWMFGIDDISYIGLGDAVEAYNVYLDGVLVSRVPAAETTFTLPKALSDGHHTLSVSAVYPGHVESAPRSINYPDEVPDMELRTLYLSGIDYDMECISAYPVQVGIDGNEMYVKGIDRAFPDAWVHGTIADGKVVFPRNQFLGNVQAYTIYMQGLMPKTSEIVDFVMDYDAETSTLTSGDVWLVFNASQTQIIYQQVLYDITISPVGNDLPDVITPPADLVVYDVEASGLLYYEHVTMTWPAQLGFDGTDVYLKGSCYQLPEAWVKGTVKGADLVFPMNQYMGQYGTFSCYLMGTTFDHTQGTVTMEDLVLTYDAATGEYVARTSPMFSTVPDFMSLLEINEDFRLSAGAPAPEGLGTVLADLQQPTAAYDLSGRRLRAPFQHGVTITSGRKFVR